MTNKEWISKGTLTADMEWRRQTGRRYGTRYLPETVGRALRLLEEKSIIAVKQDGQSVAYRWIPERFRGVYIPYSRRPEGREGVLFRNRSV